MRARAKESERVDEHTNAGMKFSKGKVGEWSKHVHAPRSVSTDMYSDESASVYTCINLYSCAHAKCAFMGQCVMNVKTLS